MLEIEYLKLYEKGYWNECNKNIIFELHTIRRNDYLWISRFNILTNKEFKNIQYTEYVLLFCYNSILRTYIYYIYYYECFSYTGILVFVF